MMFLQAADVNALQIGGSVLLAINTGMLVKLSYTAGRYVRQLEEHERRLGKLEQSTACGADDCPMRKER